MPESEKALVEPSSRTNSEQYPKAKKLKAIHHRTSGRNTTASGLLASGSYLSQPRNPASLADPKVDFGFMLASCGGMRDRRKAGDGIIED
ncbi:hypothetical protein N7474_007946 [Penicillium riverlandense]|uniref:uncharacterized protein n=1 Tax=Penicillium riverlandense TaxID=1903569 RepID=UPI002546A973|nr:uncharacterized protein N7474_007946 [Penicillium riverlandense]KAJ5811645.1 hypothetical protein N7474_007946 [Penicillium riverlandense]